MVEPSPLPAHAAEHLPTIDVDCYSLELEDEEGFTGDKVNKGAFVRILDELRKSLREAGEEDPLGDKPTAQISRRKLGALLTEGKPRQAALVHSAIEEFAQQLRKVIRRFLKLKCWEGTECIVIGGGFREHRIGEMAIARAHILLKTDDIATDLQLLHNDPDEAGLIGAAHLLPTWILQGYEAMLAADIGGTNIRAGLLELNLSKASDLSKVCVVGHEHWCHQEEKKVTRDDAVDRLVNMFTDLEGEARKKSLHLAPVIGLGCPGIIRPDGSIASGAHNLPGNWESSR
ncbi:MAG: ROK family protein, partial [Sinobacteraceae bacterium]|nr:ROK family protein [Nevskiaceae bacterium]